MTDLCVFAVLITLAAVEIVGQWLDWRVMRRQQQRRKRYSFERKA